MMDCHKWGCMTVMSSLPHICWLLAVRGCLVNLRVQMLQAQSARAAERNTEASLEGMHQQLQAAVEAQRLLAAQIEAERGAQGATQAERQAQQALVVAPVYVHCSTRTCLQRHALHMPNREASRLEDDRRQAAREQEATALHSQLNSLVADMKVGRESSLAACMRSQAPLQLPAERQIPCLLCVSDGFRGTTAGGTGGEAVAGS